MALNRFVIAASVAVIAAGALAQTPLGSAFTYQGELRQSGTPAAGPADFRFRLYTAVAAGGQIGGEVVLNGATLSGGRFAAALDFGAAAFGSEARWLEIDVRVPAGSGSYVTLTPRQRVTPAPAARYAAESGSAINATQLNGQGSSFYQNASNLTSGTIGASLLGGAYTNAVTFGHASNSFAGSGSGLTALNASNVGSGTLTDARLSGNVALLSGAQTFTGAKTFSTPAAFSAGGSPFSVSGTGLVTNLNADMLDGLSSSAFLQSIPLPLTLSGTSATHIIRGENNSAASLASGVFGLATDTGALNFGVIGQASSGSGRGVAGYAPSLTGANYGGWFESASSAGTGAYGQATSGSGVTFGVIGQSFSTSGSGVAGLAPASSGSTYGVYGQANSPRGIGVFGLVTGTPTGWDENYGVWGEASATSGYTYGLWGEAASSEGTGALGCASATSGFNYGLVGLSYSPGGTGVYGSARAGTGTTYGVWGTGSSASGFGVYGSVSSGTGNAGAYGVSTAFNGNGVIAEALSGGSAYAVWAKAPQGAGVFCQGALQVTGNKAFRIDHPDDPENKYLLHYCSEGPEPLNVYRGNVVTDASGFATIALPSYFGAINRDPTYQLTVIDSSNDIVLAKVVEEISNGSFTIRTTKPNVRVSWQVAGVRNDLYTRHYGAPVEVNKADKDRGTYQHPELYGLPQERMFGYTPARRADGGQ